MDNLKDIRWKQRFENFEKSYKLLKKYSNQAITTELERAGIIQFFGMSFELVWKVLKDYLESEEYVVKSPRETVKQAFRDIEYIKKALIKFNEIEEAVVFGSRAMGNYKKGSDIDIVIIGELVTSKIFE